MELKKGLPITSFEKGDVIIRIESTHGTTIKNDNIIDVVDDSYRKEPVKFLGIAYNLIYLETIGGYFDGRVTTALLEEFCDGWDLYIKPDFLN